MTTLISFWSLLVVLDFSRGVIIPYMGNIGNICCCEQENQKNNTKTVRRRSSSFLKTRSEQGLMLSTQKKLLHDFHQAVRHLKQYGKDSFKNKYSSFCLQQKVSQDEISSTYTGTLTDQNNITFKCLIKVIIKHKVSQTPLKKRSIAIQHLVTKYLGYPFIEQCLYFHEDQDHFYLIFDRKTQKSLADFSKMGQETQLEQFFLEDFQEKLKFVLAGVILGIEKLHSLGVVYRGINLENIVIMENGYPLLTNLSRLHPEGQGDASPAACHFTSPEQFRGQLVTKATDCWALGVLIYFFVKGTFINYPTFNEKQFKGNGISQELEDLVNKLLIYKPDSRLGSKGIGSVKRHRFFRDFPWQNYQEMNLESPLANWKNKCIQKETPQESDEYYSLENEGLSMLGLSLCIDFVTMGMVSRVLDDQASKQKPNVFEDNETPDIDLHQLATSINIDEQDDEDQEE